MLEHYRAAYWAITHFNLFIADIPLTGHMHTPKKRELGQKWGHHVTLEWSDVETKGGPESSKHSKHHQLENTCTMNRKRSVNTAQNVAWICFFLSIMTHKVIKVWAVYHLFMLLADITPRATNLQIHLQWKWIPDWWRLLLI